MEQPECAGRGTSHAEDGRGACVGRGVSPTQALEQDVDSRFELLQVGGGGKHAQA